jgi:hypothetical protein
MTEEELIPVRDAIDSLELVLNRIEQGQSPRQDPYSDHDLALKQIRDLKRHQFIPGMSAYLAACKKVLLPFRIGLMEKTLRANLVFCLVLLGFAAAPMLLKWPSSVTFLMCLPAAVWIFVTLKAYAGLRAAISEMKE